MGELVVSRGDTPEILEPAEAPLDGVAVFASLLVGRVVRLSVRPV